MQDLSRILIIEEQRYTDGSSLADYEYRNGIEESSVIAVEVESKAYNEQYGELSEVNRLFLVVVVQPFDGGAVLFLRFSDNPITLASRPEAYVMILPR